VSSHVGGEIAEADHLLERVGPKSRRDSEVAEALKGR
jgi:hypothetical protein